MDTGVCLCSYPVEKEIAAVCEEGVRLVCLIWWTVDRSVLQGLCGHVGEVPSLL